MLTVLEIIKKTTEFFAAKGIENPRLNAELLMGHVLGLKRMQLYMQFERPLTELELEKMRPLVRRRASREPLQYILGEVEWSGLRLKVDRRGLIPRPETEYLIELVAEACKDRSISSAIDLGTGSGAIALVLAKTWPEAKVTAVDMNPDSLALAKENAATLGLEQRVDFIVSDWFAAIRSGTVYDLIVANPPYLTERELEEAEPEVKGHEPRGALVASDEGRADLFAIISKAPEYLAAGGMLALETGIAQHAALIEACTKAGFGRTESRQDLNGRDRFIFAWR